jgi:mannose-6-phosphate isomerase-like protein (cupin superfamily)
VDNELNFDQVERPWGYFRRFTKNMPSTVKILNIKPNEILSLQSHKNRSEFWHVVDGSGYFEVDGEKTKVEKGNEQYIRVGQKHRMSSLDKGMRVLEISFGDFEEGDETKYEDKYGRV